MLSLCEQVCHEVHPVLVPRGDVVDGQVVVEEVEAGALVGLQDAEEVGNCFGFWKIETNKILDCSCQNRF